MKISIITAFYKGHQYLENYIKMMLSNVRRIDERDSLEVVIVNDSPEEKLLVDDILEYINISCDITSISVEENIVIVLCNGKHLEIKIVTNKTNEGIHQTRINGLKISTGKYVMFLDQDDEISKNAMKTFFDNVNDTYEVIVANASLEQISGTKTWYRSDYHKRQIGSFECYCNVGTQIISPGQCVIYKDSIPKEWINNICKKNGADDYFLWLLLLSLGVKFNYIDDVLYVHKYTGSNLSSDTKITDESSFEFFGFLENVDYFPTKKLNRLRRMTEYKANFRESGKVGKICHSIKNFDIFVSNVNYKIKTKTPYGFNR